MTAALADIHERLKSSATKRTREAPHDIEPLKTALRDWKRASWERPVTPDGRFADAAVSLEGAFDALERARREVMTELSRAVRSRRSEQADRLGEAGNQLREVVGVLSRVQSHREGDLDFTHTRYRAQGETTNDIEFRRVADRDAGSTPGEVYEAWRERGTDPAIAARWGGFLDHYIEAVWSRRTVVPGGDREASGAPLEALAEIRSVTGADTLVGYSATPRGFDHTHDGVERNDRGSNPPRPSRDRACTRTEARPAGAVHLDEGRGGALGGDPEVRAAVDVMLRSGSRVQNPCRRSIR